MSTPILKSLKAEPGDEPNLNAYQPSGLNDEARKVWDYFASHTPYWWSESDLPTVERYCVLAGIDRVTRRRMNAAEAAADWIDYGSCWAIIKPLSLELKAVEYQLGLTPQGRAALKLSFPANQGSREDDGEDADPMDPADL